MRITHELTSNLVLVVLALAVSSALVGTAVAVPMIKSADIVNETILSEDIKNGEVKTQDIGDDAVTTEKIADGAVTLSVVERQAGTSVSAGQLGFVDAHCLTGEVVTGGGFSQGSLSGELEIVQNKKDASTNASHVVAWNPTSASHGLAAYAECATILP